MNVEEIAEFVDISRGLTKSRVYIFNLNYRPEEKRNMFIIHNRKR